MRDQGCSGLRTLSLTMMAMVLSLAVIGTGLWMGPAAAGDPIATLRGAEIGIQPKAPAMARIENRDLRRGRAYPEQPPTIPHSIRDYQVDLNTNKCLSCHNRTAIEQSQAPMVSVTHFMDRDGQVLGAVSPRRYFCVQCHVTQTDARPLVGNIFLDIEAVIKGGKRD